MKNNKTVQVINKGGACGGAYFLTFVGAAVFWVQQAAGFGEILVALLKAMVWPSFVMYRVLQLLSL